MIRIAELEDMEVQGGSNMNIKFNIDQKVYYLNLETGAVESDTVSSAHVLKFDDAVKVVYELAEGGTFPESAVFSCELQCKEYYKKNL